MPRRTRASAPGRPCPRGAAARSCPRPGRAGARRCRRLMPRGPPEGRRGACPLGPAVPTGHRRGGQSRSPRPSLLGPHQERPRGSGLRVAPARDSEAGALGGAAAAPGLPGTSPAAACPPPPWPTRRTRTRRAGRRRRRARRARGRAAPTGCSRSRSGTRWPCGAGTWSATPAPSAACRSWVSAAGPRPLSGEGRAGGRAGGFPGGRVSPRSAPPRGGDTPRAAGAARPRAAAGRSQPPSSPVGFAGDASNPEPGSLASPWPLRGTRASCAVCRAWLPSTRVQVTGEQGQCLPW